MKFDDVLMKKLCHFKSRLISKAEEVESDQIKAWSQEWQKTDLLRHPPLERVKGGMKFLFMLEIFDRALKYFEAGDLEKSLDNLFLIQHSLSLNEGFKAAPNLSSRRNNSKKHEDTRDLRRAAMEYYIGNNLSDLSNRKAAIILSGQVKVTAEKLAEYISIHKRIMKAYDGTNLT